MNSPTPAYDSVPDEQLVDLARDGDAAAYGELWRRHSGIGLAIARRYYDVADADDLVAESFARILSTLRRGGGPRAGFRPYLITTIGNVARRWASRRKEGASDELDLLQDPRTIDDPVVASEDRDFALEAFRSLPERWQAVLWYSAVEGMGPTEIATHLGITPNATAVLAHRARAGLRTAWVQAHLNDETLPVECRSTAGRLGRRATGSLNPRELEQVRAHLATCLACRSRARELDQVSARLAVWLVPALLGLGLPFLDDGAPASALVPATATSPLAATSQVPVWLTTAAGLGAAASLVTALLLGAPAPQSTPESQDSPSRVHEATEPQPDSATTPDLTTLASSDPQPLDEAGSDSGTPAASIPTKPAPTAPPRPIAPTLAAPTIGLTIDPDALRPPSLVGTGAPGATIVAADETGAIVGGGVVDPTGAWSTGELVTLSPAAAALVVWQQDAAGRVSPSVTAPLAARPSSTGTVTPLAPDWHLTNDMYTPLTLDLAGWPGATVQIEHRNTGHPAEPLFPTEVRLDSDGRASLTIPNPWPGSHSVTVRYVDGARQSSGSATLAIWVDWFPD